MAKIITTQIGQCRRVIMTHHAEQRMVQRGISQQDVLKTLRNPDQRGLPINVPNRFKVRKQRSSADSIDVVYTIDGDSLVVVTAIVVAN